MEVLFSHPNFPGQFRRVAAAFSKIPGMRVYGVGDAEWTKETVQLPSVPLLTYPTPPKQLHAESLHPFTRTYDDAVRRGEQALTMLAEYKVQQRLEPDVIFTHPGFGDALFMKDIFPGSKIIGLFEYFYQRHGADVGFDPEFPTKLSDIFRIRAMNATQLMALDCCDVGICPTEWQRSRFPGIWQQKLQVLHEGIDTARVKPDPAAQIQLPDGTTLKAGDEVITFVSRCLEPYRGYHNFVRALPTIMAQRPNCHVVIVGGDDHGYGPPAAKGTTHRETYFSEVEKRVDKSRIHFTGRVTYDQFVGVLQISRVHVYLTYPFILSWSMLEAMSAGALVIGSSTTPVEEVIQDGVNGLLVPFHNPGYLADRCVDVLSNPGHFERLRAAARQTIIDRYDFETVSLPAYLRLLNN